MQDKGKVVDIKVLRIERELRRRGFAIYQGKLGPRMIIRRPERTE